MERPVRHFSLHRIDGTDLQVVSDVDTGVNAIVQIEEAVIRGYVGRTAWPHRRVALFILQDLQPLVRQVPAGASLPPGGATALQHRPVVNVYDLADSAACHVFVNRQVMEKEGYWDDALATMGLLAHEHAHPLAENGATRASRRLRVVLSWEARKPPARLAPPAGGHSPSGTNGAVAVAEPSGVQAEDGPWRERVDRLLTLLADKLCVYAPREIFANEVAIQNGFDGALLHLNRRNIANAVRSVEGRQLSLGYLEEEASKGNLPRSWIDLLVLIGDMKGYLDLALEVAPFYRTGHRAEAGELEASLYSRIFPALDPGVPTAYTALRDTYVALAATMATQELVPWAERVLHILATALAGKAVDLHYRVTVADET